MKAENSAILVALTGAVICISSGAMNFNAGIIIGSTLGASHGAAWLVMQFLREAK